MEGHLANQFQSNNNNPKEACYLKTKGIGLAVLKLYKSFSLALLSRLKRTKTLSKQMWALPLLWFTTSFMEHLILEAQKNQTHFLYGILISPSINCILSLTTLQLLTNSVIFICFLYIIIKFKFKLIQQIFFN